MNTLDLWLLGLLGLFVLYGWRAGLIQMVGSFVGTILGVALAGRWYDGFSTWFAGTFQLDPLVAKVVSFAILLGLINRAIGLGFALAARALRIVNWIPGIAGMNRLGGVVLGFLEGVLSIGVTLYVATKFDVGTHWRATLDGSVLVPILTGISQVIVPLLPGALKSIQSILKTQLP